MALPYDALTAALDAWLGQHIPNLQATVVPLDALGARLELGLPVSPLINLFSSSYARVRRVYIGNLRLPLARRLELAKSAEKPVSAGVHLISRIVTQRGEDSLLQLVHGDLVDLRVELALADLLATDAPVVLGHRRARLGGHLRS